MVYICNIFFSFLLFFPLFAIGANIWSSMEPNFLPSINFPFHTIGLIIFPNRSGIYLIRSQHCSSLSPLKMINYPTERWISFYYLCTSIYLCFCHQSNNLASKSYMIEIDIEINNNRRIV